MTYTMTGHAFRCCHEENNVKFVQFIINSLYVDLNGDNNIKMHNCFKLVFDIGFWFSVEKTC